MGRAGVLLSLHQYVFPPYKYLFIKNQNVCTWPSLALGQNQATNRQTWLVFWRPIGRHKIIENTGKSQYATLSLHWMQGKSDHLSYISALLREHGRPELKVKKLEDLELKNAHPHKLFYIRMNWGIHCRVTHESTRHPKEILQETQLVEYTGNLYLSSPYSVTKWTTNVLLPSRNVKSYTKTKPVT